MAKKSEEEFLNKMKERFSENDYAEFKEMLKPGLKIKVHRDYTSVIVGTIEDDRDGLMIAYKDWNKYKQRYDYHIENEIILALNVKLWGKELDLVSSLKFTKKEKRFIELCAKLYDAYHYALYK